MKQLICKILVNNSVCTSVVEVRTGPYLARPAYERLFFQQAGKEEVSFLTGQAGRQKGIEFSNGPNQKKRGKMKNSVNPNLQNKGDNKYICANEMSFNFH